MGNFSVVFYTIELVIEKFFGEKGILNLMLISIVICTYGLERLGDVVEAVNSLKNQTYEHHENLVVIDKDMKFYQKLKNSLPPTTRIIVSETRGLSNARNVGVKEAKGDIVAFLDDDAVANRNWLEALINNYSDDNVVGVGGGIEPLWEDGRPKWFPEALDWIVGCIYAGHPNKKCAVRNIIGCNMSFRRKIFDKVGLFTREIGRVGKKLSAGEEMELCVRALSKIPNSKIIYEPNAIVYHKVPKERQTLKYTLRRAYNEGISKAHIRKITARGGGNDLLSTERSYLKSIVERGFLGGSNSSRSSNIISNLAQTAVLWLVLLTVVGVYHLELYLSG